MRALRNPSSIRLNQTPTKTPQLSFESIYSLGRDGLGCPGHYFIRHIVSHLLLALAKVFRWPFIPFHVLYLPSPFREELNLYHSFSLIM